MPTTEHATASSVHLDAVRGAAAIVVLLGHTRDLFFSSLTAKQNSPVPATMGHEPPRLPLEVTDSTVTIGHEAVMIFFVLSGYLVGASVIKALKRYTWSWKIYLIKRLTRLWVVLVPALVLGVALDYVGLHVFSASTAIYAGPSQQSLVPRDVGNRLSVPVIAANAVFLQSILVSTAGTNASLWSLSNEFWYYIAFPVLLLALRRNQTLGMRCVYLLLAAGIVFTRGQRGQSTVLDLDVGSARVRRPA